MLWVAQLKDKCNVYSAPMMMETGELRSLRAGSEFCGGLLLCVWSAEWNADCVAVQWRLLDGAFVQKH